MHNENNITTPFPLILARLKNTHIVIKQLVNDLHRITPQKNNNSSYPSRPKSTTTLSRNPSGRYNNPTVKPYPEKFNKISNFQQQSIPSVKISSSPIQIRTTPINIIKNQHVQQNNNTASSLSNSPETSDSDSDENEVDIRHKEFRTLQKMELSEEIISCIMGCCNRVNNANNDPTDRRSSNPLENSSNIECRFLQAEKSLEWCVKQLTQLSIHKSLGAMANEKYKEIIRQEFDKKEHSSSVTEFITSTFFERSTEKQEKPTPTRLSVTII